MAARCLPLVGCSWALARIYAYVIQHPVYDCFQMYLMVFDGIRIDDYSLLITDIPDARVSSSFSFKRFCKDVRPLDIKHHTHIEGISMSNPSRRAADFEKQSKECSQNSRLSRRGPCGWTGTNLEGIQGRVFFHLTSFLNLL